MNKTTARYETVAAYDMQLDAGEEGKAAKVILSLRVLDGENMGQNLTSYHYLSPAAAPYTMKALKALGWTGTKLSRAMAEGLGTRKATAQLKFETYNGKTAEKVTGIYEFKVRGPKNPVDDTSLDAFDAMFEDLAATAEAPETELTDVNKVGALPEPVRKPKANAPVNPNADLNF